MAKNISPDALVTVLSNEKVLDALKGIIQDSVNNALERKFGDQIESLNQAIEALQIELKLRNGQVTALAKQNAELSTTVHNQAVLIENLESYNRQENLIVQGLPLTFAQAAASNVGAFGSHDGDREHSSDTEQKFLQFCHTELGLDIKTTDISICHRLPKHEKQQYPPVIVRFTNRKSREMVLSARKKLRNADSKVFINEHLTRATSTLFSNARKLARDKKVSKVWTKNGRVLIKTLEGTISRINSQGDLDSY